MRYIPDQIQTHEIKNATLEKGKFGKKVIHHAAGAPAKTNDTGEGYAQGSIWVDTTNGDMYVCTDHTAENAGWVNMEGDDVNVSTAWQGLTYGYELGGDNPGPQVDKITRFAFAAPYPSSDVGELAQAMQAMGVGYNSGTGFTAGGLEGPSTYIAEVTSFPTSASSSVTVTDKGDLNTGGWAYGTSGWSPTKGYTFGGQDDGPNVDTIQDYAFSAPFSSSDVSEVAAAKDFQGASDSPTHTFITNGYPAVNNIYYYQKDTTNDASDIGEVTQTKYDTSSSTDNVNGYGFVCAGADPVVDTISRYAHTSSAPSSDVGELSANGAYGADRGAPSLTHGHFSYRVSGPASSLQRHAFSSPYAGADISESANAIDYVSMIGV